MEKSRIGFLSGNLIKIMACVFMTIDHIGLIFFPTQIGWRIAGRLAMPLFAFMIAEGAYYTKNRIKYLLTMLLVGIVIEVVYIIFTHDYHMNILLTFSLSLILIYLYDLNIKCITDKRFKELVITIPMLVILIVGLSFLFAYVSFDYSYLGLFIPLAIYATKSKYYLNKYAKLNNLFIQIVILALMLLLGIIIVDKIEAFALLACPILLFYNNKRGRLKLKYFFYLYYPLHIGFLYLLYMWIH